MLFDKFSPLHQPIAHYILALQNQHIECEEVQGRAHRAIVLQRIEDGLLSSSSDTTSPSMTVSFGMRASTFTMPDVER